MQAGWQDAKCNVRTSELLAKMMIQGTTMLVAKAQDVPDMTAVQGGLREMRGDAKAIKEEH